MDVNGQFQAPATLPLEKETLISINKRLDGIQSQFGYSGACATKQTPVVQPAASHYTNWSIAAYTIQ